MRIDKPDQNNPTGIIRTQDRIPEGSCLELDGGAFDSPAQQPPVFLNSPAQAVAPSQELSHAGLFHSSHQSRADIAQTDPGN